MAGADPLNNEIMRGSENNMRNGRGNKAALAAVRDILDKGHDVNKADASGITALLTACQCAESEIVAFLIERGADVNQATKELRITPLQRACGDTWRHTEMAKLLLDAGADINQADARGWTPLMMATLANNAELVKLLCSRGAQLDTTIKCGMVDTSTAADLARERGFHAVVEAIEGAR